MEGLLVGQLEGCLVGSLVGWADGWRVGQREGCEEGQRLGWPEGGAVGRSSPAASLHCPNSTSTSISSAAAAKAEPRRISCSVDCTRSAFYKERGKAPAAEEQAIYMKIDYRDSRGSPY